MCGAAMNTHTPQDKDGALLKGLFVGALVGGAAAWLFAPCRGSKTRALVRMAVNEHLSRTQSTLRLLFTGTTESTKHK